MGIGVLISMPLFAQGVDDATKAFLAGNEGGSIIRFLYIGAKHMVTGYDHLLFLIGDVLVYVLQTEKIEGEVKICN